MNPSEATSKRTRAGTAPLLLAALAAAVPLLPTQDAALPYKHLGLVLLALSGGLVLLVDAFRRRLAPRLGTPTDLALLAFFGFSFLSAVDALNPGIARYELLPDLALALVFVLAVKGLRRPSDVRLVGVSVLLAAAIVSLFGLAGYQRWVADGSPEASRLAALSTPFFAHPYLAGQYVLPALVAGLVLLAERAVRWRVRALLVLVLAPSLAYVVVTGSRGALLALGVSLVTAAMLRAWSHSVAGGGRGRPVLIAARAAGLALLALVLLVTLRLTGAFESLERRAHEVPGVGTAMHAVGEMVDRVVLLFDVKATGHNYSRLTVWKDALDMAADHSLLGVGVGGFDTAFPSYHASEQAIPHAHNQFVHVLAESGVLGLLALLFVVRHARRAVVRGSLSLATDDERRPLALAASAALVALAVTACFETPLLWVESGTLCVVLLAIVSRAGCTVRDGVAPPWARLAGVAVVVTICVAALPVWSDGLQAWSEASVARDEMDQAVDATLSGDGAAASRAWDAALAHLAEADAHFPYRPDYAVLAAQICTLIGRSDEADSWNRRAVERMPGASWLLAAIGLHALREGRAADAIEPLRAAAVADDGPSALDTKLRLARAYRLAERWDEAAALSLQIIEDHHAQSSNPTLLLEAADVLLASERDIDRADVYARIYRGLVPEKQRDTERLERLDERLAAKQVLTSRPITIVPARER